MAVPKRRKSRARTRMRRSNWRAETPELVPVTSGGQRTLVPRALLPAYHRGLLAPVRARPRD